MSNDLNDPWHPSRLTLPRAPAMDKHRSRRQERFIEGLFIRGPIPVSWLAKARALGVSALWVALGLWHLKGLKRSDSFIVSNQMMGKWGVLADAKLRALKSLERAGLIAVERRGKRSPRVTILKW